MADLTWPVITAPPDNTGGNYGNTTTGMSAQIFINGTIPPACKDDDPNTPDLTTNCLKGAQLIVWIPHFYTAIVSCSGERATVFDNQIILNNVIKPEDLAAVLAGNQGPNTVNPELSQPTFWVGPKQVVFSTLRLFGELTDVQLTTLATHTGIIVRSQPDTSPVDASDDSRDGTIDITPPTLDFPSVGVNGNVEGNTTGGADVTLNVTASDSSGVSSLTCSNTTSGTPVSPTGPTFFALGSSAVSCTATDGNGNAATGGFTVNVVDTTPPTVTVPSDITASPTSTSGANVVFTATATDAVDAAPVVTCVSQSGSPLASGSLFPIGTTTVSCTARDASNNVSAAKTFSVTVGKASTTTTVTITSPNATYDGLPHGATAQVTSAVRPQPVVDRQLHRDDQRWHGL